MKTIFAFIDFREFLSYYYTSKKAETRFFSYRYFAQKAGINSSSFLKHVIEGRRNLSPAACVKFCNAIGFNDKEALYFRHLVLFNQAKTTVDKQEHYAVLQSFVGNVKEAVLKPAQYEYFSNWYVPVVRELICLHTFKSFGELGRAIRPPIGAVAARNAVGLLEKLGMIQRRKDGSYEQTAVAVTVSNGISTLAQRQYVASMMKMGGDAVLSLDKKERHTSSITIGISQPVFDVIAAEIEAFKNRIKIIVSRDTSSSKVFQLNCALFPISTDVNATARSNREVQS